INNYDKKYHTNYISIKEFEKDIKVNSENIFNSIKNNNYKFQSLYPIVIENKKELNKKPRLICIPTVRDRLIQMILIYYISIHLKNELAVLKSQDFSVSGVGILKARQKAKDLRNTKPYVLKTDISSFFDNIDRAKLLNEIKDVMPPDILYLFQSIIYCDPSIPYEYNKDYKKLIYSKLRKGVRQGMPISPLLASFYLNDFDEWLIKKKYKHVRYADDLIFFLDSEKQCKEVYREVSQELLKLNLTLPTLEENTKTQIISPKETVNFLGLDLRYENEKYNWYIPPHVIENVKYNLLHLTNIQNNLKMKLNFSKTISRMEQIISGYQHCYSDADSLNLKDFNKILILEKQKAINLLFKNLGIDISTVHSQYLKYLLDN
ncbi:reverse transcriptase domain-containing protein, partial [Acinetobacter baumannii]